MTRGPAIRVEVYGVNAWDSTRQDARARAARRANVWRLFGWVVTVTAQTVAADGQTAPVWVVVARKPA